MRRFFVKNILFVLAVNILVKPIWVFFIDRTVQNTVPAASYGTYQALLSLSIIFQAVLDFGISSYNSRTIAQQPDRLPDVFPAMLSARLALIVVYLALAMCWGYVLGYRGWELTLLSGTLLIQSLNALVSFVRSNIAALHRFKTDSIISITDRLLMIIICGFLLAYPPLARRFKIEWFVATQIFCYFVAALAGYLILRRIGRVKLRFSIHLPTIFSIIKESFPYALLIFLMSIYNRADAVMIERLCKSGKEEAGIWAAAFRLLDMVNIFGLMFATVLLPMFGRMISKQENVQPIVKLCVNMMAPFSVMVGLAGVFFCGPIMELLYHKSHLYQDGGLFVQVEYALVFACLIASFPSWCLMYIYSTLLTANGSLKTLNIIAAAGVVLNLSLNFWLIPRYQALGGAITSFITQTTLALTFMIVAARVFRLPFTLRWVLAHIGYLVMTIAIGFIVLRLMGSLRWEAQLAVFCAACAVMMFAFRFVSVRSLRLLTKWG